MQFMLIMIPKDYKNTPAEWKPGEKEKAEMAEMGKFNDSLRQAGVLKSVNGLTPPAAGARIVFGGGQPAVTRGPFAGTTETVGGYWILELDSQEEAIAWMKKCPAQPGDVIEVRQIAG